MGVGFAFATRALPLFYLLFRIIRCFTLMYDSHTPVLIALRLFISFRILLET